MEEGEGDKGGTERSPLTAGLASLPSPEERGGHRGNGGGRRGQRGN